MTRRSPAGVLAASGLALALLASPAQGAPPSNDVPGGAAAGVFQPYTADNGVPTEMTATAELAEATADAGVPRCLGPRSFQRTVWYRLPETAGPTEVTLEATGRTLSVVDLAAFVQAPVPEPAPPPTTPPPARAAQVQTLTSEPNQCDGIGAGGAGEAEEPTSAVSLRVPARHPVLFQVGRRGTVRSPDLERVELALEVLPVEDTGTPRGDRAGSTTPKLRAKRLNFVELAGATLTDEDPSQPPCPSLGSVWRKLVPTSDGRRLLSVSGTDATTLTAFRGRRPTGDNVLDCVNREGSGAMRLNLKARKGRTIWVRIGADRTSGLEEATVRLTDGSRATVIDGGPGGFDPTPGGPGGGFPSACDRADAEDARISGPKLRGRAGAMNRFTRVPVSIRVRGASVCDAELRLHGPGGAIYAKALAVRLKPGRQVARLPRLRTFRAGRYRLQVKGVTLRGKRFVVPTNVKGRLRR